MGTRLLIPAVFAAGLSACASQPTPDVSGLMQSTPETARDVIRNRVIQNYLQAPHHTRREPDAVRIRNEMALPNRAQLPHESGTKLSAKVQMFFAAGTPLGVVVETLAKSMGYDAEFERQSMRSLKVRQAIRGEHEIGPVVSWLSERTHCQITVFPESRLVMVYAHKGTT